MVAETLRETNQQNIFFTRDSFPPSWKLHYSSVGEGRQSSSGKPFNARKIFFTCPFIQPKDSKKSPFDLKFKNAPKPIKTLENIEFWWVEKIGQVENFSPPLRDALKIFRPPFRTRWKFFAPLRGPLKIFRPLPGRCRPPIARNNESSLNNNYF